MKVFVRFLLFASLSIGCKSQPCSSQVEIICSKIENMNWNIGTQLTCDGEESITSKFSDSSVSSVVHSSKSQVANLAQIIALTIVRAKVKFIPFGIKTHFIDIKVLMIYNCGLLSVSKENLQQFGNSLEVLALHNNKLTSIDADLLEYNPNLKAIYLNNNPIRHIDSEFFTNLKNLKNVKEIDLQSTNCMHQQFSTSPRHNIATFTWNSEKCIDYAAKLETKNLISSSKCLSEEISKEKDDKIIDNNENSTSTFTQNFTSKNNSIKALESELTSLNNVHDNKTKTLIDNTNKNIQKTESSIITHGNKSRDEIIGNFTKFASTFTEQFGSVNNSIKALDSELKSSTYALQNEHKILIENHKASINKLESSLATLGNKSSENFNNLKEMSDNLTTLIKDHKDSITEKLADNAIAFKLQVFSVESKLENSFESLNETSIKNRNETFNKIAEISENIINAIEENEKVMNEKLAKNENLIGNFELNLTSSLNNMELQIESKLKSSVKSLDEMHESLTESRKKSDEKFSDFKDQLDENSKTVTNFMKIVKLNNKKSVERADKFENQMNGMKDQISGMKEEIDMLKKLTLALTAAVNQQNSRVGDLMEHLERNTE